MLQCQLLQVTTPLNASPDQLCLKSPHLQQLSCRASRAEPLRTLEDPLCQLLRVRGSPLGILVFLALLGCPTFTSPPLDCECGGLASTGNLKKRAHHPSEKVSPSSACSCWACTRIPERSCTRLTYWPVLVLKLQMKCSLFRGSQQSSWCCSLVVQPSGEEGWPTHIAVMILLRGNVQHSLAQIRGVASLGFTGMTLHYNMKNQGLKTSCYPASWAGPQDPSSPHVGSHDWDLAGAPVQRSACSGVAGLGGSGGALPV